MHKLLGEGIDNVLWQEKGSCLNHPNPEWWMPGRGASNQPAKEVCETCPVKKQCLEWALKIQKEDGRPFPGIYGGLSMEERKKLRICRWKDCTKQVVNEGNSNSRLYCSEEHARAAHALQVGSHKKLERLMKGRSPHGERTEAEDPQDF